MPGNSVVLHREHVRLMTNYIDSWADMMAIKSKVLELVLLENSHNLMVEQITNIINTYHEHINYMEELSNQLKEACGEIPKIDAKLAVMKEISAMKHGSEIGDIAAQHISKLSS